MVIKKRITIECQLHPIFEQENVVKHYYYSIHEILQFLNSIENQDDLIEIRWYVDNIELHFDSDVNAAYNLKQAVTEIVDSEVEEIEEDNDKWEAKPLPPEDRRIERI